MSMFKEFREFAVKGNVIDLAIAVVLAAAFGKIVTSFVDDILMPPVGVLLGKHDFSDYFITLAGGHYESVAQAKAAGAATLNYGMFINTIITFLIVAFAIFLVIRSINKMARKQKTPNLRDCPECLSPIPIAATRCKFCSVVVTPTTATG